nr:glucosaminidase domain-containing protein [Lentilactobacillus kisonensis]
MAEKSWHVIFIILITTIVIGTGIVVRNAINQRSQSTRNIPTLTEKPAQQFSKKQKNHFIDQIATPAMQLYQKNREILPSVVIAQAILESQFGTSLLYKTANNLFGVKGTYQGQSVTFYTREVENGKSIKVQAQFRKYPSLRAALIDHNQLVARKFIKHKNIMSYRTSTSLLQENGYATDPHYASKLDHLIVKYHLSQYDLRAINE